MQNTTDHGTLNQCFELKSNKTIPKTELIEQLTKLKAYRPTDE